MCYVVGYKIESLSLNASSWKWEIYNFIHNPLLIKLRIINLNKIQLKCIFSTFSTFTLNTKIKLLLNEHYTEITFKFNNYYAH
jgi:hypothetical protein